MKVDSRFHVGEPVPKLSVSVNWAGKHTNWFSLRVSNEAVDNEITIFASSKVEAMTRLQELTTACHAEIIRLSLALKEEEKTEKKEEEKK